MVMDCVYCGLEGEQGKRSFFVFPKCPEQRSLWIRNMNIKNFCLTKNMRLCSDHFEEKYFQKGGNNVKLNPGSQPTLFGTYKSACAYCKIQKNESRKNVTFHKFPLSNEELLNEWLEAIGIEGFTPTRKSILCSDHFHKSCFFQFGNIRLKKDAVPTIFITDNSKGMKRPHSPSILSASENKTPIRFVGTCTLSNISNSSSISTSSICKTPNAENEQTKCVKRNVNPPKRRRHFYWFANFP